MCHHTYYLVKILLFSFPPPFINIKNDLILDLPARNQKQKSTFIVLTKCLTMTVSCVMCTKYMQCFSVWSTVQTPRMFAYSVDFPRRHIQDPASQRLTWSKPPLNVLIIRKIQDETLLEPFKELCRFLVEVGYTKSNLKAMLVVDLVFKATGAIFYPFIFIILYKIYV